MVTGEEGNSVAETLPVSAARPWRGTSSAPFDAHFYTSVLPDRVVAQCQGNPGAVPVVNLHLANGRVLDLCHIMHLTERWFAVQYFRDTVTCADMDVAFLPYELVVLVSVALQHSSQRRIGFNIRGEAAALDAAPAAQEPPA